MEEGVIDGLSKYSTKFYASLVTFFVIGLLILAGPAQAFSANLGVFSDVSPKKGDIISTVFNISMQTAEIVNITSVNVSMIGSVQNYSCSFDVDGNKIDCNKDINLFLIDDDSNAEWIPGYGYGLEEFSSVLSYNLTINTSDFDLGTYQVNVTAVAPIGVKSSDSSLSISKYGDAEVVYNVPVYGGTVIRGNDKGINATLILNFEGSASGSIIIEQYSVAPRDVGSYSLPGLDSYFVINAEDYLNGNISSDSELRIYYEDAEVIAAGIIESTLRLYYWSDTLNTWSSPLDSGVNTEGNYVWARTNHFSTWRAFGDSSSTDDSSGRGGGLCITEWTVSEWSECIGGVQTRTVSYPRGWCAPKADKPLETRTCSLLNDNQPIEDNTKDVKTDDVVIRTTARGWFLGIVIFLLLVGLVYLIFTKKRNKQTC
jgi:hypothetical protein